MELTDGNVFHIYNRGNQRQQIFFTEANYQYFLQKMANALLPHADLLAYCLMPNHFHWLVQIKSDSEGSNIYAANFSKAMAILLRSYARAMQRQQGFTGSLFQQNSKSKILTTENDVLTCFNYIHQNPVKASLVQKANAWEYSSIGEYLKLSGINFCNNPLLYNLALIDDEYNFIEACDKDIDDEKIKRIFA
ncbi:MAG: transposase [Bacteroidetes bacterium]|nr:transposase [Bacteroidota bacterium]